MKKGLLIALAVVGVIVVGLFLVAGSYIGAKNQMVAKKEAVDQSWSQVDIQLQRRADLIPNLVSTVKGFATQEQTVFGDIANARAGLLNARDPQSKIAANNTLDGAFGRLLALTENYPQLRSNENFLRLQDELSGTENRIAVERRRYNETLQDYNTFIQQFPNSVWAGIAGFQRNPAYFCGIGCFKGRAYGEFWQSGTFCSTSEIKQRRMQGSPLRIRIHRESSGGEDTFLGRERHVISAGAMRVHCTA